MDENYVDRSIYVEDATFLIHAIDGFEFKRTIAKQINVVTRYAMTEEFSADQLMDEITKLRALVDVYRRLEKISEHDLEKEKKKIGKI